MQCRNICLQSEDMNTIQEGLHLFGIHEYIYLRIALEVTRKYYLRFKQYV